MDSGCRKNNENIYFVCRKKAAAYNEKLWSREGAAELLGISVSTLANYELDITKVVPVDIVVMMSDLYNAPELKNRYCKNECPIGRNQPITTEAQTLESITVKLMNRFNEDSLKEMKSRLLEISEDGIISEDEMPDFQRIVSELDKMAESISAIRIVSEKMLNGGNHGK